MRSLYRRIQVAVLLLAVVALTSACGGGGGDNSPRVTPTPDPPPPPVVMPTCVETILGCLKPEPYEAERQAIADVHVVEDDFKNQWGLASIRADQAYAQLELAHGRGTEPGRGQTVGLLDTGIDSAHPVFAGKAISEHFFGSAQDETGEEYSHGTAVASVIAARRGASFDHADAQAAHGVAWGADIAMFAVAVGDPVDVYKPISWSVLNAIDDRWATRVRHILGWSSGERTLDFVNVSLGYLGIIEQYGERQLRTNLGDSIAALAQAGSSDKTVFVWSAGNAHGDPCHRVDFASSPSLCVDGIVNAKSVEILPGLTARIPELRGHSIAVVAVAPDSDGDGDHEITEFSNRCGIAKDWCIAAPGEDVTVAYFGPDESIPGARRAATANGTSFAAPMVTGALVVMKDQFRDQLSNTDLVSRLLATADKVGIYADADVYGQGLLDLAAATSPWGTPQVALDGQLAGAGTALARTGLRLGHALGDGLTQALAGQEIAAFDALGAPFWYGLGSFTGTADGPSAHARLRDFMAQPQANLPSEPWRPALGVVENADGAWEAVPLGLALLDSPSLGETSGHLSLAGRAPTLGAAGRGSLAMAAFSTEGVDGQTPVSGATFAWRPAGAPLGVHGGWVGERETLLGSRAAGAFGSMEAASTFAGIEADARLGAWRFGAGAEIGAVSASVRGGLIADVSPLTTSTFAVQAERALDDEGSAFTLSLSQPLRVEAGHARLSVPIGRTRDGRVERHAVAAELAPSGRQVDVVVQWRRPLVVGGALRLGAVWARHPGHAAEAPAELTVLAGWRHTF